MSEWQINTNFQEISKYAVLDDQSEKQECKSIIKHVTNGKI